MLSTAELIEARELQLAAMPDRCEIRFHSTVETVNGTETEAEGAVAVLYQGQQSIPCRIGPVGGDLTNTQIPTIGGERVPVGTLVVTVPFSVVGVERDRHLVKVTACTDAYLVGRRLPIVGVTGSSFLTARRLVCLFPEE